MTIDIPDYIEERIRRPIPDDLYVLKNSIPVISFGDASKAKVVTISINPSNKEFVKNKQEELLKEKRRFEILRSLDLYTDVYNLENAPHETIQAVYQSCLNYFSNNLYYYKKWFNPLEKLLNSFNVSYFDSTACHLDLVQWATSEKWNELSKRDKTNIQKELLKYDVPFLKQQLENNKNIEVILLNGTTTLETVKKELEINLNKLSELICKTKSSNRNHKISDRNYKIFEGRYEERIKVIAWSAYLQNLMCQNCTDLKSQLAKKVKELVTNNN